MRAARLSFLLVLFALVGVIVAGDQPSSATAGESPADAKKKEAEAQKKKDAEAQKKQADSTAATKDDKKKDEIPADKGAKNDTKKPAKGAMFEAVMEDKSTVQVNLLDEKLTVVTKYGKLEVPVSDLRDIEFSPRPFADVKKRVRDGIKKLGSDVFADREAASKALLALGPAAYPALQEAARSDDLETKKRALKLMGQMEEKYTTEDLARSPDDRVRTPKFTIVGEIQVTSFKVSTRYFGEKSLKLTHVRSMRTLGPGRTLTVAIDSSRYGTSAATWMETNVIVRARARLSIKATGEIDMYPIAGSAGVYRATPEGGMWAGVVRGIGTTTPGKLVGKIGKTGSEFAIGKEYKGNPTAAGVLYLRIIQTTFNVNPRGEYKATIVAD